ncbi:hypothetical protein SAMN05444143_101831 [Flavobacterium succinicans]|uniref:SGNH/GDSL hydrolase family protein n=1 Tax=Flavobacterium succinicans TaxID=29536 RepID=A0A1I4SHV5_9FLAO|nr:hypothetical protein [Flavobacterium succinicans]SFM63900.1 hypothetical protein SAMN05444143_101831 [Flavobacterium succinicans]
MKQFLLYTFKILLLTIAIAVVLDFGYTKVFLQSSNRGKIEKVFNSKGEKYDVVILGSSRANNHFVAPMFEDKGLRTFNYGMSGGHLFEASLLLKLMIERNYQIKSVILEADLNLSNDHQAEGISAKFLPFLHESETIKNHFKKENDFTELYCIPFYRYVKYDAKIGVRETFFTAVGKTTSQMENKGYYPLGQKPNANMKNNIANLNPLSKNQYYYEIKQLCEQKGIKFIAVMTPMCENTKGMDYFDKVKKLYPEIHNYENVVSEDRFFSSCGHLNDAGARLFTERVLKDFFNK